MLDKVKKQRNNRKLWAEERAADTNLCWPPATLRDKLHWWTIFPTLPLIHYSSLQGNNKWMAAVGNLCSTKCVNMAPSIQYPILFSIAMHWAKIHHNAFHFTRCNPHRNLLNATEKWIFHNDGDEVDISQVQTHGGSATLACWYMKPVVIFYGFY